jgi:hypothetical protein
MGIAVRVHRNGVRLQIGIGVRLRRNPQVSPFVDTQMYRVLALAVIVTFAWSQDRGCAQTSPADPAPRTVARRPPATRTALAGTWAGTIIQVQKSIEYSVTLEIGGGEAKISYSELRRGGKLTRIGSSGDYCFFVETITRRPADDNGRCTNGSITVTRAGDNLAWAWFGLANGEIVAAYGILTRKSVAQQAALPAEEELSIIGTPRPTPHVRKRSPATPPAPPL